MTKKLKISIFLFILIIINYILTRFIYFNVHGMKDFPNTMSLLSAALTCLFILSENNISAICSTIGNTIGFFIGLMFYSVKVDYITGNTSNLWLIWGISYFIVVILGMVINKMFHVKH